MEPDVGVSLELIEEHTGVLNKIVNQMMEDMMQETRILEGTVIEDYTTLRNQVQNELSQEKLTEEQWMKLLHSGFSTTDPIPTSRPASSNSSCIAEVSIPTLDTLVCEGTSCCVQTDSCKATLGGCGCETGALNASSGCTDRTTSDQLSGTPNEAR